MTQMGTHSLQELFIEFRSGDITKLHDALTLMRPILLKYAHQWCFEHANAEDAVQNTMIKLFEQLHHYDGKSSPLNWAITILSFECKTLNKKYARRKTRSLDTNISREHGHLFIGSTSSDELTHVRELLSSLENLSDKDKQLITELVSEENKRRNSAWRKRKSRFTSRLRKILSNNNTQISISDSENKSSEALQ